MQVKKKRKEQVVTIKTNSHVDPSQPLVIIVINFCNLIMMLLMSARCHLLKMTKPSDNYYVNELYIYTHTHIWCTIDMLRNAYLGDPVQCS